MDRKIKAFDMFQKQDEVLDNDAKVLFLYSNLDSDPGKNLQGENLLEELKVDTNDDFLID